MQKHDRAQAVQRVLRVFRAPSPRGRCILHRSCWSSPRAGALKYFSQPADRGIKDPSDLTAGSARSNRSTKFSSEEIEVRLTGLRETIVSASDPATMMDRVLAGALVLVPSADGAVIGLCTDKDSLVFAAAS